jgi:hypothetical protein
LKEDIGGVPAIFDGDLLLRQRARLLLPKIPVKPVRPRRSIAGCTPARALEDERAGFPKAFLLE